MSEQKWTFQKGSTQKVALCRLILVIFVAALAPFQNAAYLTMFLTWNATFSSDSLQHLQDRTFDKNVSIQVTASDPSPSTKATSRLFYCGWNSIPKDMFPEYDFQERRWDPNEVVNSTRDDILVVGMYGPCLDSTRFFSKGGPAKIHNLFQGKVLYINGEAYGHLDKNVIEREYQIGPYSPPSEFPDSNSLLVYFFAVCLGIINSQSEYPLWDWIFDPNQRRHNTGKHNGVAYYAIHCLKFRQKAAMQISEIVPVYYGKGCTLNPLMEQDSMSRTNAIQLVENGRHDWVKNHQFLHDFKYCLAMENREKSGYITEKLLNAFLAGCLPIYYGTNEVFDIFNERAFLFLDINKPQETLERIKYLEGHPEAYMEMLRAPILKNGSATVNQYFSIYPNVGSGRLNHKIRNMMGLTSR